MTPSTHPRNSIAVRSTASRPSSSIWSAPTVTASPRAGHVWEKLESCAASTAHNGHCVAFARNGRALLLTACRVVGPCVCVRRARAAQSTPYSSAWATRSRRSSRSTRLSEDAVYMSRPLSRCWCIDERLVCAVPLDATRVAGYSTVGRCACKTWV